MRAEEPVVAVFVNQSGIYANSTGLESCFALTAASPVKAVTTSQRQESSAADALTQQHIHVAPQQMQVKLFAGPFCAPPASRREYIHSSPNIAQSREGQ